MKKKLYIAKKACLDEKTGKVYYTCEIDPDDVAAALLADNVSSDTVNAIVDVIANPEKANITEIEEDAPTIACAIGDYYWDCLCNGNLNDVEAEALKRAADVAMDGMRIEGYGTLREIRKRVNAAAMWHDIKEGIAAHIAEMQFVRECDHEYDEGDYDPDAWEPEPEIKWAYIWEGLLEKAAEIHKRHPEGITGRTDKDGWILFAVHEAYQAAGELGGNMRDFYAYAKSQGFVTWEEDCEDPETQENVPGVYHIMPYEMGSLTINPILNAYPNWPY